MTLGEFIEDMKGGWGFTHPGTVASMGYGLEKAFEGSDLDRKVEVTYTKEDWGSGHYGRIEYRWRVKGIAPAATGTLPPTDTDLVFGAKALPPFCQKTDDGFIVGYNK